MNCPMHLISKPVARYKHWSRICQNSTILQMLILLIVALIFRVWIVASVIGFNQTGLTSDDREFEGIGWTLAQISRYAEYPDAPPTARRSPLLPLLLAGIYSLVGHQRAIAQGVLVLISAAIAPVTFLLAKEVGDRRAGLLAGLWVVFDPFLLIYTLAHFGFWTLGVIWSASLRQSRLLLPGLVGLIPIAGWVWVNLPHFDLPHFSLSRFVNIAIGLILALTAINVGLLTLQINPVPYLVGLETREQHLMRRLGAHYAVMQQINEMLPPEAKVVFLWEPRSYYCQRDCRPDSILDSFPHLVYQHNTADAIAQTWRSAGVTHLLIHRTGLKVMLKEQPTTINVDVLNVLESNHLEQVFDVVGAYQVYALKERP